MVTEGIDQDWQTYGMRAQSGTREDFFGMHHSLLSPFFSDQHCYIMKNTHAIIIYSLCEGAETVYDYHYYQLPQWCKG
jgi:hypothetical protein